MPYSKTLSFIIFVLLIACPLWWNASHQAFGQTSQDGIQVRLIVDNCNHNNICEPWLGENFQGCASDCAPPPPATTTPSSTPSNHGGSHQTPREIVPSIIPSSNDALISWDSNQPMRGTLSWGVTSDYELGTIAEINYGTFHSIKLNNLSPGTRYFFRIESSYPEGIRVPYQGEFFTLPSPDTIPPSNVSGIRIELKNNNIGNYILGTWINPSDNDFAYVRVVRQENFYSESPSTGKIIYQGAGNSFEDYDIKNDVDYYYSFFSRDVDGNYSGGSVIHFRLILNSDQSFVDTNIDFGPPLSFSNSYFNLSDFEIMQQKGTPLNFYHLSFVDGTVTGETGLPIVIIVSREKIGQEVKYILLSVQDQLNSNHFNSYLIRELGDKNFLETTIPAFQKEGTYRFFVTFLGSDKQVLFQSDGAFKIENPNEKAHYSIGGLLYVWISQIIKWIKAFFGLFSW